MYPVLQAHPFARFILLGSVQTSQIMVLGTGSRYAVQLAHPGII